METVTFALTCTPEVNEELAAMTKVAEALTGKDIPTCARILDWAADIFTNGVLMDGCIRSRDFLKPQKNESEEKHG